MTMTKTRLHAWWFSSAYVLSRSPHASAHASAHDTNRQIALGHTHTIVGNLVPHKNGLIASARPLDALIWASGPVIWRVALGGTVIEQNGQLYAAERTCVAGGVDASAALLKFCRDIAPRDGIAPLDNPMGGNPMGGNPMGGNPMGGNPMGGNPVGSDPMGAGLHRKTTLTDRNMKWPSVWDTVRRAAWYAARDAATKTTEHAMGRMRQGVPVSTGMSTSRGTVWDRAWEHTMKKLNTRLAATLDNLIAENAP